MSDLSEQSDAFLIGSIVNGEADAVRPLIERYQRSLVTLLRRALDSAHDVDDVAQETWIRVVRSAHRYDPAQRFSAWLFAIAWNLVRNRWAKKVAHVEMDMSELPHDHQSAEERMVARDQAMRVREMVDRLPDRMAEAILLRYFEELSEKEMAERLGVPVGTVKSRLHHGLKRLAAAAQEETR